MCICYIKSAGCYPGLRKSLGLQPVVACISNLAKNPKKHPSKLATPLFSRHGIIKANVFVKPNEQNRTRSSYVMARKGAIKWSFILLMA